MSTETTNSDAPASESALSHPSLTIDQAMDVDFHDPGADNAEAEADEQSEVEPDEVDTDQETEESETADAEDDDPVEDDGQAEDEGDEPEAEAAEISDDTVIALQSGEKLPLNELKAGYMRQADYSRKTQETANMRRDLEATAKHLNVSFNAVVEHLTKAIPAEPDQAMLFSSDPKQVTEYHRRKAIHDNAMAGLAQVIEQAKAPQDAVNKLTEQQHKDLIASESAKLAEAFPQIRTPDGHKKFFEEASQVARELGYSDEEIGQAVDHRLFRLAHYARLGLQAEAAKAKAVKKVANVPPVAPASRQPGWNATKVTRNRQAMAKLSKTGSLDDALALDYR